MELKTLAEQYRKAYEQVQSFEKDLKLLAEYRDKLKASLMQAMTNEGLKTANVEGVGRFTLKPRRRYEIADQAAYARLVALNIVEALEKGHPADDCPLFQMRVAVGNMDEYLTRKNLDSQAEENYLRTVGLRKVEEPSLSMTKS